MHSYYGCLEAPLSEDLDSEESVRHSVRTIFMSAGLRAVHV